MSLINNALQTITCFLLATHKYLQIVLAVNWVPENNISMKFMMFK